MTINKLTLMSVAVGLFMTSCSTFNPEKTAKEWDVVKIGNEQVEQGMNAPYLGFNEGQAYGFTGCNRINGGIAIDGATFKAKNVATTMKFCPNAKYEQNFLKALNEAEEIKQTKQGFALLNKEGDTLMECAPRSLDVKELEGQWNVESINGIAVEAGANVPFIIFDLKENRLSGFSGCNRLNCTLNVDALKNCTPDFSNMAMTRKFCQDNPYETVFVDAMNQAKTIRIADGKLLIYAEGEGTSLVLTKE